MIKNTESQLIGLDHGAYTFMLQRSVTLNYSSIEKGVPGIFVYGFIFLQVYTEKLYRNVSKICLDTFFLRLNELDNNLGDMGVGFKPSSPLLDETMTA